MTRVVESVAPDYGEALKWNTVITKTLQGARRYVAISQALGRPAPVPAILIDGNLMFETTPGEEELRACLNRFCAPAAARQPSKGPA